jgi:hypothetical protein
LTTINQPNETIYHSQHLAISHIRKAIELCDNMPLSKRDYIMKWKKKLRSLSLPDFMPYDDLYSMTIGLPTGIFSYQFDTPSVFYFLQKDEIQPIDLEVDMMMPHVDQAFWREHRDDTPYPPVVLETPLLPKGYLLLGHKAIMEAKKKGKKKLSVYVLTEMEFVPLMFDDMSKSMYSFHRDLQNLLSTPMTPPLNTLFLSHIDSINHPSNEQ